MSQPISVQDTHSRICPLAFMFHEKELRIRILTKKIPEILDKRVCRVVHLQYPGRHLMPRNVKATN